MDVPSVEAVPQDAAAVLEPVAAEQQLSAQPAPDCAEERSAIETLDMQPGEGLVSAGLLSFCPLMQCKYSSLYHSCYSPKTCNL